MSLRDLPATIIDLLGLPADSPFPGGSLAACWRSTAGSGRPPDTPALSEADFPEIALDPRRGRGPTQRGYTMSLVTRGWHSSATRRAEGLFDLRQIRESAANVLRTSRDFSTTLGGFRRAILHVLTHDPVTSGTVEEYLKRYRRRLEAIVQARPPSDDPRPTEPRSPTASGGL